jgi:hypothetical protein
LLLRISDAVCWENAFSKQRTDRPDDYTDASHCKGIAEGGCSRGNVLNRFVRVVLAAL